MLNVLALTGDCNEIVENLFDGILSPCYAFFLHFLCIQLLTARVCVRNCLFLIENSEFFTLISERYSIYLFINAHLLV